MKQLLIQVIFAIWFSFMATPSIAAPMLPKQVSKAFMGTYYYKNDLSGESLTRTISGTANFHLDIQEHLMNASESALLDHVIWSFQIITVDQLIKIYGTINNEEALSFGYMEDPNYLTWSDATWDGYGTIEEYYTDTEWSWLWLPYIVDDPSKQLPWDLTNNYYFLPDSLRIVNFSNGSANNLDIRISFQPIPEPSTLILLSLGILGVVVRHKMLSNFIYKFRL